MAPFTESAEGRLMPRVGQTRRRDAAEQPIVEALRAIGCHVTRISGEGAPDLLVRHKGRVYGFEVKTGNGTRTQAQRESLWPVIRSVAEAFAALGVKS